MVRRRGIHLGGGAGFRVRRLTLAPATAEASTPPEPVEEEIEAMVERRAARGRKELSELVEAVAAECCDSKPVHVVQVQEPIEQLGAIQSKFWTSSVDHGESDDEDVLSTPEFIRQAQAVGFSFDELVRADKALSSGTVPRDALATSVGQLTAA